MRTSDSRPLQPRPYNARWRKARLTYLKRNPLCRMCQDQGKLTPATVVDHIKAHKGSTTLFWDTDNWQPLCSHHHNSTKQAIEKGKGQGCASDGTPLDPAHPWNT